MQQNSRTLLLEGLKGFPRYDTTPRHAIRCHTKNSKISKTEEIDSKLKTHTHSDQRCVFFYTGVRRYLVHGSRLRYEITHRELYIFNPLLNMSFSKIRSQSAQNFFHLSHQFVDIFTPINAITLLPFYILPRLTKKAGKKKGRKREEQLDLRIVNEFRNIINIES